MGRVYRATDTTLGRPVALKILSHEQALDNEALLRFRNEARSAARLNHDGIVQVYYVGDDAGLPFIAFEFVEGINIRDLVEKKGPLPLAEAVSYTLQIAEALAHAASRNVVHRDVKPSNILITGDGRTKLIDMGLARLQMVDNSAADLTASGVTLGTFDYISPEQARDPRNADVRSDIYSLGCTLFFMLTGRPPFPEGTVLQKLLQHQGDEPPEVRELRPDLPEEVSRVLRKMMAKDPRRRYQDPAKLIMALLTLAELAGLQRIGPGQTVWVTPRDPEASFLERHVPWLAPVAALGCIVLLLHVFWSSGLRGSPSQETAPMAASTALPASAAEDLTPVEDVAPRSEPNRSSRPEPSAESTTRDTSRTEPASKPVPPDETTDKSSAQEGDAPQVATSKAALVPPKAPADPVASRTASAGSKGNNIASDTSITPPRDGRLSPSSHQAGETSPPGSAPATPGRSAVSSGSAETTIKSPASASSDQGAFVIVGANHTAATRFNSLASACNAAVDGDVIELCFNGRREEKPISPIARQITIRAGDGFQPVITFRPTEVDPIRYSRNLISFSGSRLNFVQVAIELEVPREVPADHWALFQVNEGQELHLENSSLTIRNASDQQKAYHPEVAFVQLKSALSADATIDGETAAARRATITLINCVARGEAVFLHVEDLQPVNLTWRNGLLATTERLLVTDGNDRDPLPDEMIQVDLQHLTALARAGLCCLNQSEHAPHPWPLQVRAAGCIFLASESSPLVEQIGVADVAEALARFTWHGEHNFYEGFTVFWRIRPLAPSSTPQLMTFDDWQAYWHPERETVPNWNLVQWRQLPALSRPVHLHTPADYGLRSSNNPALGAGGDDHNAGVLSDRLPPLPAEASGS